MTSNIPLTQTALQLIGPDQLRLNNQKDIPALGPHHILAKVEAVGLCFSDLKLLKQFADHARKSEVISGIDACVLADNPSYRPGALSTVPGHEACCKIIAVGNKVSRHKAGQRVLVQTDYRWLKTSKSNAAFGYNFEGALQQYVLMDERIIVDPQTNQSFLLSVDSKLSSSEVALVEPWACVEGAYLAHERQNILSGGKLLIVADAGYRIKGLNESFSKQARPRTIECVLDDEVQTKSLHCLNIPVKMLAGLKDADEQSFDDIIYFGCDNTVVETLDGKLAAGGMINIVLDGKSFAKTVSIDIGRIHYGNTRWIGTATDDASDAYTNIPASDDIRDGDKILVIGAAGPMGQMHFIRLLCSGKKNISVTGTDCDDQRLLTLEKKVQNLTCDSPVDMALINPQKQQVPGQFSYFSIMAPIPSLVAQAVQTSCDGAIINIFAGIPAGTKHQIDLDTYIANKCFMFGTSGSRLYDMKIVLEKVLKRELNTNLSVEAISGMAGVIDAINAVENRTISGKIIVYPQLQGLPLIGIADLYKYYPTVSDKLEKGHWNKQAENELLKVTNS